MKCRSKYLVLMMLVIFLKLLLIRYLADSIYGFKKKTTLSGFVAALFNNVEFKYLTCILFFGLGGHYI